MRSKVIQQIVRTNILYTLPPGQAKRFRDKQTKSKGKSTGSYLLQQNFWSFLILVIFYSVIFYLFPIESNQNASTSIFALFIMIAFLNLTLTIINVFFESKDFGSYRHLPITSQELVIGKGISVLVYSGPYLFTPIIFLFILAIKVNNPLYITLPMALFMSILILTFLVSLGLISVYVTLNTKVFKKHKKAIFSIVLPLLTFISYFSFYAMQNLFPYLTNVTIFNKALGIYFLSIFSPFSLEFFMHLLIWLSLVAALITIVVKVILPKFYDLSYEIATTTNKKSRVAKKTSSRKSIQKNLIKYNIGLIFDRTNFVTFVVTPLIFPIIMLFSLLNAASIILSAPEIGNQFLAVSLFLGVAFAILLSGQNSFLGISISLDRENYSFIKAMPFSMEYYLKIKFFVAFLVHNLIPLVILVVLGLMMRIPLLYMFFSMVGYLGMAYYLGQVIFKLDYDNLNLNWQNVEQLLGRGVGKVSQFVFKIISALIVLVATFALGAVLLAVNSQVALAITIAILIIFFIVIGTLHLSYQSRFWKKLQ